MLSTNIRLTLAALNLSEWLTVENIGQDSNQMQSVTLLL